MMVCGYFCCFYRPYKGLKLCITCFIFDVQYFVFIVPIRDWNSSNNFNTFSKLYTVFIVPIRDWNWYTLCREVNSTKLVFIVPIRDWNAFVRRIVWDFHCSFYRPYKGLKLMFWFSIFNNVVLFLSSL